MTNSEQDLEVNRALWTLVNAEHTDARAEVVWAAPEITWGLFEIPERDVGALGDVAGLDVIELGCGTAYFSGWLARRGARPVGVDLTPAQLDTARRCQRKFGLEFPLIEADAAAVPLADDSFDLAVSEYGASVWCDPELWVREAARLLRPGGRLVFLTNSVLATLCVPEEAGEAGEQLLRPQRDFEPRALARRRHRIPSRSRRLDPHTASKRLRRRRVARAVRAGRGRGSRLLRDLVRALGGALARRRPVGAACTACLKQS